MINPKIICDICNIEILRSSLKKHLKSYKCYSLYVISLVESQDLCAIPSPDSFIYSEGFSVFSDLSTFTNKYPNLWKLHKTFSIYYSGFLGKHSRAAVYFKQNTFYIPRFIALILYRGLEITQEMWDYNICMNALEHLDNSEDARRTLEAYLKLSGPTLFYDFLKEHYCFTHLS